MYELPICLSRSKSHCSPVANHVLLSLHPLLKLHSLSYLVPQSGASKIIGGAFQTYSTLLFTSQRRGSMYFRSLHNVLKFWDAGWSVCMRCLQNVMDDFVCALQKKILLQGRIYVFEHYVCFYANIFGYVKKLVIPLKVCSARHTSWSYALRDIICFMQGHGTCEVYLCTPVRLYEHGSAVYRRLGLPSCRPGCTFALNLNLRGQDG